MNHLGERRYFDRSEITFIMFGKVKIDKSYILALAKLMAKKTPAKQKKIEAITGEELIQKVKQLDHQLSKEEKAKACGYYSVNKNGIERVNMMQFLNALIEAEGIDLDSATKTNGRGGRSASYRIHVQSNGNLLVGSAYTKELGLQTGDEFEVILGRKHIRLKQIEQEGDIAENAVAS